MSQKIFCIGFHKTGTKSMAKALRILGYTVTGPNGTQDIHIASNVYNMATSLIPKYDAFQDNPWPIIYKEIDRLYPESKFILTLRDSRSWIKSQINYFGNETSPMRKWIYGENHGCPKGNEKIYIQRFEAHNRDVKAYFQNRQNDLLVMNIFEETNHWEKLAAFLEKEIPDLPFPHENKTKIFPGKT